MKVTISIINKLLQVMGFQVTCNSQPNQDIILVDIVVAPKKKKKTVTAAGLRANYKWN